MQDDEQEVTQDAPEAAADAPEAGPTAPEAEVGGADQATALPGAPVAEEGAAVAETEAPEGEGEDDEAAPRRRSQRRNILHGQAHIKASFNNTIINITDLEGNSLAWTSGGSVGFKGSRKSTPYAAQVAAEQAARRAGEFGIRKLDVVVRGSGSGRETAVRTLQTMGMEISHIVDVTPTPHNGPRAKKRRRG